LIFNLFLNRVKPHPLCYRAACQRRAVTLALHCSVATPTDRGPMLAARAVFRRAWAPLSLPRSTPHVARLPRPPSAAFPPPRINREPRRRRLNPPVRHVFLLRFDATPAVPLASASSCRTAPEDVDTPPKPPSIRTPSRRPLPATPPSPDLLGEPRLRSLCPT
jgi:hypothetical protein